MQPVHGCTPVDLVDGLVERVQEIANEYFLQNQHTDETRSPTVYAQHLPDIIYEGDKNLPAILVTLISVTAPALGGPPDGFQSGTAEVGIWAGSYFDDEKKSGWRTPTDILWRTLIRLTLSPMTGPFRMLGEGNIDIPVEQPHPYFHAMLVTTWEVPVIQDQQSFPALRHPHFDRAGFKSGDEVSTMGGI
jgi:hypothetical protein